MANQNLSQFGEKLFVADADHTFIWDSTASISKRVSRNSWLNSGTLTSDAPVTISQTWNNAAVAFTGLKVDATNTNSAAASKLLDLQVGGASLANFSKAGHLIFPSSSTVTPSGPGVGQWVGTLALFGTGGSLLVTGSSSALNISGNVLLSWNNDTILLRDGAANTLALRNGTAAQTFRVYNTFPGTGNNEYAEIAWVGNFLLIRPAASGTATVRGSVFGSSSSETYLDGSVTNFRSAGNNIRWTINSSGHFVAGTDNSFDIGASGANRPRNVYVGSNIYAAGNVGIGTTAPAQKLEVWGNSGSTISKVTSVSPGTGSILWLDGPIGQLVTSTGNLFITNQSSANGIVFETNATEKMRLLSNGNLGIGTTSPTSKLHVAGNSSPSITVDNTLATGASQLLFKNTVVTGDTDGIFLNGSTQTGFGGAGSLNIKATTGPIAFHTASFTNAMSIAQSGVATFAGGVSAQTVSGTNNVTTGDFFRGARLLLGADVVRIGHLGDGILEIKDGLATGFNRVVFGGGTSSFPSLKRVGTDFQVVLASTTAATNVAAGDADLTFIEDRYRRKGSGDPNTQVTAPIGAVYHNITGTTNTSFWVKESGTGNTGWVAK